jgi:hypothetical protein
MTFCRRFARRAIGEAWVKFFLTGVAETANQATNTASYARKLVTA